VSAFQFYSERSIDLRGTEFKEEVKLTATKVDGHVYASETKFEKGLKANWLRVALSLDLKNATLAELDLSDASVGALIDSENAWPPRDHLILDSFSFSRLDHSIHAGRSAEWWDQWVRRDPHFSPYPYQQLAFAFAASGDRDLADEIRFRGRVREQESLNGMNWLWSWPLRYIAGFGIYPHMVLYWIAAISLAGPVYLWRFSKGVRDAKHSRIWCWGATLARLLPGIEINKEFTEFFDDPRRERLSGFQMAVFSTISVLGWFLAAILVAALSGVAGKS
jgi:hypothetical protein